MSRCGPWEKYGFFWAKWRAGGGGGREGWGGKSGTLVVVVVVAVAVAMVVVVSFEWLLASFSWSFWFIGVRPKDGMYSVVPGT